jgi:hypothetical protein
MMVSTLVIHLFRQCIVIRSPGLPTTALLGLLTCIDLFLLLQPPISLFYSHSRTCSLTPELASRILTLSPLCSPLPPTTYQLPPGNLLLCATIISRSPNHRRHIDISKMSSPHSDSYDAHARKRVGKACDRCRLKKSKVNRTSILSFPPPTNGSSVRRRKPMQSMQG